MKKIHSRIFKRLLQSIIFFFIINITTANEFVVKDILIDNEYYFNDLQNLSILDLRDSKLELKMQITLAEEAKDIPLVGGVCHILISTKKDEILVARLYYDDKWLLQKVAKFDPSKTRLKNLVLNLHKNKGNFDDAENFYVIEGDEFIKALESLLRKKSKIKKDTKQK